MIVSTRSSTWVAEILEKEDCVPVAELGWEDMLEDRSKLKPVGDITPGPDNDGEYAPLLGPELWPPPPPPPAPGPG